MIGEIIAIGDELTSGRILNTTSGFAASQLFAAGYEIFAMHTIGDTPDLIGEALKRAISRVDFVIVTGGLGATTDDLTNEAVSEALSPTRQFPRPLTDHRRSTGKYLPKSSHISKATKTTPSFSKNSPGCLKVLKYSVLNREWPAISWYMTLLQFFSCPVSHHR